MKSRPAETGGVAAALALLVARLIGIDDADAIVALGVVVGFVPAAITWLVVTIRSGSSQVGQRGYALVELLVASILVVVLLVVLLKLIDHI